MALADLARLLRLAFGVERPPCAAEIEATRARFQSELAELRELIRREDVRP